MEFLHFNKVVFSNVIDLVSKNFNLNPIFIEKDYYVFMLLKLIYSENDEILFKGGTSLSKAWRILNRFSEDVDLNLRPDVPSTDSHRMKLNNSVYNSIIKLGFNYDRAKMSSRREYNVFEFPIAFSNSMNYVRDVMKIEAMANKKGKITNATYTMLGVSNYIYDALYNNPQYVQGLNQFMLTPFALPVQNMDVTFVEKVMSLTNRYIRGESTRLSRHLYDIYQMWTYGNLSQFDLNRTMYETKIHLLERTNDKCLRMDRSAKSILYDALYSDFYKQDFNEITQGMKMNPNDGITYEMCKNTLLGILNMMSDF